MKPLCKQGKKVERQVSAMSRGPGICALEEMARYLRVLAQPSRLLIIEALREKDLRICDLTTLTGTTTANVSRHMAMLCEQGFVSRISNGGATYYRLVVSEVDPAFRLALDACNREK